MCGATAKTARLQNHRWRENWSKILKGPNLSTGCSMISIKSAGPKTLFAGMWDFRRNAGHSARRENARGQRSGFFQTTDGGSNLERIGREERQQAPAKPWGRVAVRCAVKTKTCLRDDRINAQRSVSLG